MVNRIHPSAIIQTGHWAPHKRRNLEPHLNEGLELVWVKQGHLMWQVEGQRYPVGPNSLFLTLPWQVHGGTAEQEPGCELFFIILRLDHDCSSPSERFGFHAESGLSDVLSESMCDHVQQLEKPVFAASPLIAQLMPHVVSLSADELQRERFRACVTCLLYETIDCMARAGDKEHPNDDSTSAVWQFLLQLDKSCHEPWQLEQMADTCHLGRTQFAKLVKRETGDSPMVYLNRLRIERAKHMLTARKASIVEVALTCGFSTSQYFSKQFKAFTGMSPGQYRKGRFSPSYTSARRAAGVALDERGIHPNDK